MPAELPLDREDVNTEQWARWAETERKLAERIAYHEAKLAEQQASPKS